MMMNILDLIIIYLAFGSPLGVYYFINNRNSTNFIVIKSFLVVLFSLFYAIYLFHTNVTKRLKKRKKQKSSESLKQIQKEIEQTINFNNFDFSLFDLREVIERYKELTVISYGINGKPSFQEYEFYNISGNRKSEISAICLNRRNNKKLLFHQKQARKDFIKIIRTLLKKNKSQKILGKLLVEFVKLLNDDVALVSLNNVLVNLQQTQTIPSVIDLEKELWIRQKQLNEKQISIPLQTLTAAASVRKKD